MSVWTHAICTVCWEEKHRDRQPHTVVNVPAEACCFCGKMTTRGIYVRHDPNDPTLHCEKGQNHDD